MRQAQATLISGGRLHLHHGPIDLIIGADPEEARGAAFDAAQARFGTILEELVEELPLLRASVRPDTPQPAGSAARRMLHACLPHAAHSFLTPMAAVAGGVAEEILAAMVNSAELSRAYVNNGGDIALHLANGTDFKAAIAGPNGARLGCIALRAEDRIAGIATSGQGGRSLSFGIADSVTVLAKSAASADVAATLIANAVDLPGHLAIRRAPASDRHPDSDLGERRVVVHVGPLTTREVMDALAAGCTEAERMLEEGQMRAAYLCLRGTTRTVGPSTFLARLEEELAHA